MIPAVVLFRMAEGTGLAEARSLFQSTVPRYLGAEGLIRKYYIFDEAAGEGGGCYLFRDRAAAEAMFNEECRAIVTGKYGVPPRLQFFETPVVVDNRLGEVEVEPKN
jgi:hypothetical protein